MMSFILAKLLQCRCRDKRLFGKAPLPQQATQFINQLLFGSQLKSFCHHRLYLRACFVPLCFILLVIRQTMTDYNALRALLVAEWWSDGCLFGRKSMKRKVQPHHVISEASTKYNKWRKWECSLCPAFYYWELNKDNLVNYICQHFTVYLGYQCRLL